METARLSQKEDVIAAGEKFYMENTLLRVAGALFCHDAKRASIRTQEIELNGKVKEKNIVIRPDARLGQPGPLAHKVFVALIKKHSDYGRPIQNEVSFTKREIMRMVGRKSWGGNDSEELSRALHEIHYTIVKTHFKDGDARFIEHSFNVFSEILIERRECASDPIEACTVTLARPIVSSLQDEHFTCLNHALMTRLGTIGQALYMRLFFHLSNLYDGANSQRLTFQKRYDDICVEWLGGLTILAQKSKIVGEQLGRHLDQLVELGFLSSYVIEGARTQRKQGFTIGFCPGRKFFEDYDRFYRRQQGGHVRQEFRPDRRDIAEPLKSVALFTEKRTGIPMPSIATAYTKDVETARQLLAAIPFGEMPAFIDYALGEARKTNFDVQTIGGIKQYLPGYMIWRKTLDAAKAQRAARAIRERADADRSAYEHERRSEANRLFETLPAAERAEIEMQATAYAASFGDSLRNIMFAVRKTQLVTVRHGDQLTTFDQWASARTA